MYNNIIIEYNSFIRITFKHHNIIMINRILAVDDDPVSLALIRAILTKLNYSVNAYSDSTKAWENLKENRYDVIILDMDMPVMNGLILTQKIRNLYNDECMILMMTGHEEIGFLDEALSHGVDDYIVKPISSKVMHHKMHILENQVKKLHERQHYQNELIKSQEYYRAIFQNSSVGVLLLNLEGEIIEYNDTLCKMTGYIDIVIKEKFIPHFIHRKDAEKLQLFFVKIIKEVLKHNTIEIRMISRSGLVLVCKFNANLVEVFNHPEKNFIMVLIEDITEKKQYEAELVFNALHDPLTNLPNRELFFNRLHKLLIKDSNGDVKHFAVLILDIDRLQLINETLGHSTGDILIQQVARRLFDFMEPGDTFARLIGDEFGIISEKYFSVADLTHFINKLRSALKHPINLDGHEVTVTMSIGIKVFEGGEETTLNILRDADTALHRAKNKGPDSYSFFIQEMTLESHHTLRIEHDLRKALDNHELELYFQPQLDLKNFQITGAEVLLRWNHSELGYISPSKFIPIAENAGIIVDIGNWVFRQTMETCKLWDSMGIDPLMISINFSSIQIREKNLIPMISQILGDDKLNCKNRLQIEITESILMKNPMESIEVITKLTQLGINIAVDDFGTGYSSFLYLKMLPANALKIDMSFIENITHNESDRSIVMAIISMAHSMNLKAIAEGVETKEQLMMLQEMNCDSIQGYYISKALSETDFIKFLSEKTSNNLIYNVI